MRFSYEVRCEQCGYVQLWGLEQMIRALIRAGKLRATSECDAVIVSELFRVHIRAVRCPGCSQSGALRCWIPQKQAWEWADEVRCVQCGRDIPPVRLAAIPGVKFCVACQRERETS